MFAIIQAAGWPIWPLLACSVVVLALIIERFMALRTDKVVPPKLLNDAIAVSIHQLPAADTVNKLEQSSALGRVMAAGFRAVGGQPNATREAIADAMEEAGRSAVHGLERFLPAIATIASAAPLLGLLGTVVGMIEIFGSQGGSANNGTNPQQLAHGISVALYNTAFGLIIAIPALMFHRYFRSVVDGYVLELESGAKRFADHLSRLGSKK